MGFFWSGEGFFLSLPRTRDPAFSKFPFKDVGEGGLVASRVCAGLPACSRVFMRSRGLPIIMPAAPDT